MGKRLMTKLDARQRQERIRSLKTQLASLQHQEPAGSRFLNRWLPEAARTRLLEWLGGSALGGAASSDEPGFRLLGDSFAGRDLSPLSHDQMLRVCRYLYESDDLAGFLVDVPVDLACGGQELGYKVTIDGALAGIEDPQVLKDTVARIREYLDPFWEDPIHDFRDRTPEYVTSLMIDGCLALQIVDENDVSGLPRLDYIDAGQIKGVRKAALSAMTPGFIEVSLDLKAGVQWWEVVSVDRGTRLYAGAEGMEPETTKALSEAGQVLDSQAVKGRCFYWRWSRIPNSLRGRSYLLRPADWLDALTQFGWAGLDRANLLNSLLWDVTMKGASPEQCAERLAQIQRNPPTVPNTIQVHNDSETWEAKTADFKSAETSTMAREVRTRVLGGKAIPEGWFSAGSETNRATLGEQSVITLRALQSLQRRIRQICSAPLNYAYDRLQEKQPNQRDIKVELPPRIKDGKILVTLEPELPILDDPSQDVIGTALGGLSTGLGPLIEDALLSKETSRRVVSMVVSKVTGMAIDADEEAQRIEAEKGERDANKDEERARLAAMGFARALPTSTPGQEDKGGQGDDDEKKGDDGGEKSTATPGASNDELDAE